MQINAFSKKLHVDEEHQLKKSMTVDVDPNPKTMIKSRVQELVLFAKKFTNPYVDLTEKRTYFFY